MQCVRIVLRCEGGDTDICTADDAYWPTCYLQSRAVAPLVSMPFYSVKVEKQAYREAAYACSQPQWPA